MRGFVTFLMTLYCLCLFSCCGSQTKTRSLVLVNDTIPFQTLGIIEKKKIVIDHDIDLKGCVCILPKGITLVLSGGAIKNGTLKGNMTKLECKGIVFDKVAIMGSWDVPQISTSMFADLSYENALRDVIALTHPKVQNIVVIEKGIYSVKALKNNDVCVSLGDNTSLVLEGTICLLPNDYKRYNIIQARGRNITIKGNGTIIGDKHTHTGDTGEWGMGINLKGTVNTTVSGITIKDCWGDCIYVGGNSKNVTIENCWLDHGRRQGISVTKADSIIIRNCKISNVKGTRPECAIDLEPNANDTVDHIIIENVETVACEGGILATIGKRNVEKKKIGQVTVRNCKLSAISRWPLRMKSCEHVSIEDCTIKATNEKAAIYSSEIYNLVVKGNTINIEKSLAFTLKNTARNIVGKNVQQPIETIRVRQQDIRENIIIEH